MERIAEGDLLRRIRLNRKRLASKMYCYPKVFNKKYSASWPGDWEGRCILSLTSLYFALDGYKEEQLDVLNQLNEIMSHLKEFINEDGYFGNLINDINLDEQQVSGNSWYLRGLIEYYQITKNEEFLEIIKNIINKFIYKIEKFYENYPIIDREQGEVSGHIENVSKNGWLLSSDVGCAFILLDGMSEAYYLIKEDRLKNILIKVIDKFINIDFMKLECQTHATLSCCRGILTFYKATNDKKYLEYAVDIFTKYINYGMTNDYSNINWFNRKSSWTEPCCIVDSIILCGQLFDITNDVKYIKLFNRIYLNSIVVSQRGNGGAGCNTCLVDSNIDIKAYLYEAFFCCTMRLAEGLRFIKKYSCYYFNNEIIITNLEGFKFLLDNNEIIEVKGDIYKKLNVDISFKNIKKNMEIAIYLPENIDFTTDISDYIYKDNLFKFKIDSDLNINFKFRLKVHQEEHKNFVGDKLLVKRNEYLDKKCFIINNQKYYYLIDYSKIKNKNETMEINQEI